MQRGTLLVVLAAVVAIAVTAEAYKPAAWKLLAKSPKTNARVTFTFALKQKNMDVLEKTVLEISDPTNPKYSNWLSREEILDLIAPPAEVPLKFTSWIEEECEEFPKKIENLGDAVKVTTTAACAEKLLNIKTAVYQHKQSGAKVVRRLLDGPLPTVRSDLTPFLDFVAGISQLPILRQAKVAPKTFTTDQSMDYVIPATCRGLYNIPANSKATNPRNSQSAIEFSPEGAPLISDMVFLARHSGETFTNISKIVGPFHVNGQTGNSILDVEYLTTIGTGAFTWYITIEGWIYDFGLTLFNTPNPPLVNSVSYGWAEEDQCSSWTNSSCNGITNGQYVAKANNELLKVAGLGLSVLACSQDAGAPSDVNLVCEYDTTHPLWPVFPASSPWVTAVSGTTLIGGSGSSNPPTICKGYTCGSGLGGAFEHPGMPNETYHEWTTGGGFSKYAPRPSWQSAAVSKYLASDALIPPTQWFNPGNRGYPDISALGARILTIQGAGKVVVTAGTSASTPIIAGIITLLNDYRLNNGKKPLGFLNPLLYQAAAARPNAFNTINAGNNKGTIGRICTYGYGCWNGWSPVTGLGSPNYQQLLSYIKTLP